MIKIRKSDERGRFEIDWLKSRHTFSFGEYYDPHYMGFHDLRVINEDRVVPGGGFAEHGHRDMEIVSYVLEGALEHNDSLGNGSIIRPGDVQRMSAGTGIRHSEYNHSDTTPVHFLQIWIHPESRGLTPSYEQRAFPFEERRGRLRLVASRDGRDGSVIVYQDVNLYSAVLIANEATSHRLTAGRYAWLQVVRGQVTLNNDALNEGDGAAVSDTDLLNIQAMTDAEILLFDLS